MGRETSEQNLSNLDDPSAAMDDDSNDVPEIMPTTGRFYSFHILVLLSFKAYANPSCL